MCVFSPEVGLGQGGSRQGRTQGAQWEQAASSGTQAGRFDKQEDLGGLRCGRGRQALNHPGLGGEGTAAELTSGGVPGVEGARKVHVGTVGDGRMQRACAGWRECRVSAEGPAPVGGVAGAIAYQPHLGLHRDSAAGCLLARLPGPTRGGGRGSRARPRSGRDRLGIQVRVLFDSQYFFFLCLLSALPSFQTLSKP